MLFNLFNRNKNVRKEEIEKKYKIAITPPQESLQPDFPLDMDIDIVLGENIKRSKYTQPLDDSNYKKWYLSKNQKTSANKI